MQCTFLTRLEVKDKNVLKEAEEFKQSALLCFEALMVVIESDEAMVGNLSCGDADRN